MKKIIIKNTLHVHCMINATLYKFVQICLAATKMWVTV